MTNSTPSDFLWRDSLTFDEKTADGAPAHTWAFSPNQEDIPRNTGYAYLGPKRLTIEDFAWVVMVR